MTLRRLFAALLIVGCSGGCGTPPPPAAPAHSRADIVLQPDGSIVEATVPRNATLASLLRAHAVSEQLAVRIVEAARRAFDPRDLRASQPYRLELGLDGLVRLFEYKIDADKFLRIVGVAREAAAPEFEVEIVPYEKQTAVVSLRGEITRDHPSLVAAFQAHGENVLLAMALADVFAGDIDFNNDLQPGDGFEVAFEKRLSAGEFAGYGPIVAAEFRNEDRVLRAFRFEVPGKPPDYYDEQGRSRKRFFLRSPLKFEPRISSGFSFRRLHPVLKTFRAHPAIDYVAPIGAPVVAIASGVVARAGWAGGAGNMVTLRHSNGYESNYLHLSSVARGVRAGARVSQGEVIGRVGSTGMSTGAHLDYRLKKNGNWVNPLVEHKRLPPGEPVAAAHMPEFLAAMHQASALLVGAAPIALRAEASGVPETPATPGPNPAEARSHR